MPRYEDYPSPATEPFDSSSEYGHATAPSDQTSPHSSFEVDSPSKRSPTSKTTTGRKERKDGDTPAPAPAPAPSHVLRALELIRAKCHGQPLNLGDGEGDWVAFTDFAPADYRRLRRQLEDEPCVARYFADKIRHDYDPSRCALVLRHLMPSSTHDVFISSLVDHIKRWLEAVKTQQQEQHVEEVLSRIKFGSTSDLEIKVPRELTADDASPPASDTYRHSPDGQFLYRGHKHPPFVIEIGYSQKRKDLAGLAKHYYEESDGRIKTVLTVDLEYLSKAKRKALRRQPAAAGRRAPRSREASFSLYRGDECAMSNQLFRDAAGELVPGDGITLHLSDLVPDYVLDRLSKDLRLRDQDADRGQILHQTDLMLHVSPQNLFDALAESEAFQEDRDRTYSPSPPPQAATVQPRQKRKVKWELEEDDEDEPDECTLPERPGSASSKRRRLSPDSRTYASSRRSSLRRPGPSQPRMTRSRSRASQEGG